MKAYKFLPLVMAVALAACGEKAPAGSEAAASAPPAAAPAPAAPAPAPAPAASAPEAAPAAPAAAAAAGSAPSAGDLAKGEKIYGATCVSCHGAGVLGAPKFGDKAAWAPRIAKGIAVLHTNGINGFNMMPPKGGNASLKDDEMKAAIDYMVAKSQ